MLKLPPEKNNDIGHNFQFILMSLVHLTLLLSIMSVIGLHFIDAPVKNNLSTYTCHNCSEYYTQIIFICATYNGKLNDRYSYPYFN